MKYQKKQQTIVGIDYSLNSPAICIAGDDFDFNKCSFHFLTSKKKHIGQFGKNIIGYEHKEWKDPIERFTTCNLAIVNFNGSWKKISSDKCKLELLVKPKEI